MRAIAHRGRQIVAAREVASLDAGGVEDALRNVDRRVTPERECDRVRRSRVDVHDPAVLAYVDAPDEGVVLEIVDVHLVELPAKLAEQAVEQIVGERSLVVLAL